MEVNGMIVVVCHGPDTLVFGPFVDESSAQEYVAKGPCDNEHDIVHVIVPPHSFDDEAGYDEVQPRCDICGQPQWLEGDDWNGDTGNHLSCENVPVSEWSRIRKSQGQDA